MLDAVRRAMIMLCKVQPNSLITFETRATPLLCPKYMCKAQTEQ